MTSIKEENERKNFSETSCFIIPSAIPLQTDFQFSFFSIRSIRSIRKDSNKKKKELMNETRQQHGTQEEGKVSILFSCCSIDSTTLNEMRFKGTLNYTTTCNVM